MHDYVLDLTQGAPPLKEAIDLRKLPPRVLYEALVSGTELPRRSSQPHSILALAPWHGAMSLSL